MKGYHDKSYPATLILIFLNPETGQVESIKSPDIVSFELYDKRERKIKKSEDQEKAQIYSYVQNRYKYKDKDFEGFISLPGVEFLRYKQYCYAEIREVIEAKYNNTPILSLACDKTHYNWFSWAKQLHNSVFQYLRSKYRIKPEVATSLLRGYLKNEGDNWLKALIMLFSSSFTDFYIITLLFDFKLSKLDKKAIEGITFHLQKIGGINTS